MTKHFTLRVPRENMPGFVLSSQVNARLESHGYHGGVWGGLQADGKTDLWHYDPALNDPPEDPFPLVMDLFDNRVTPREPRLSFWESIERYVLGKPGVAHE